MVTSGCFVGKWLFERLRRFYLRRRLPLLSSPDEDQHDFTDVVRSRSEDPNNFDDVPSGQSLENARVEMEITNAEAVYRPTTEAVTN